MYSEAKLIKKLPDGTWLVRKDGMLKIAKPLTDEYIKEGEKVVILISGSGTNRYVLGASKK